MSKPPSTITIKKKKDEMMALELTKTTFINFPIDEIRESIRQLGAKPSEIQLSLGVISRKRNRIQISLKELCFIHLIVLENRGKINHSIYEILTTEIQDIMDGSNEYLHQLKMRNKISQPVSAGLIDLISPYFKKKSQTKVSVATKESLACIPHLQNRQILPQTDLNLTKSQASISEDDIQSRQTALCKQIIQPYCSFLLKSISSFYNMRLQGSNIEQLSCSWGIINSYRYLMRLIGSFPRLFRYYARYFRQMILALVKIFDLEIKTNFQQITKGAEQQLYKIKMKFDSISLNQENPDEYLIQLKNLQKQFQIKQLKQLLVEIGAINEQLYVMYYCKYTYDDLIKDKIRNVQILNTWVDEYLEMLIHILREIKIVQYKKTKFNKKIRARSNLDIRMSQGFIQLAAEKQSLTAGKKPKYLEVVGNERQNDFQHFQNPQQSEGIRDSSAPLHLQKGFSLI